MSTRQRIEKRYAGLRNCTRGEMPMTDAEVNCLISELATVTEKLETAEAVKTDLLIALKEIIEHPAAFSDGARRLWQQAADAIAKAEPTPPRAATAGEGGGE